MKASKCGGAIMDCRPKNFCTAWSCGYNGSTESHTTISRRPGIIFLTGSSIIIQNQKKQRIMNNEVAIQKTNLVPGLVGSDYLTQLSRVMSPYELQIIGAKYAEKRIDQMSAEELLTNVADCLRRIHIITGWNLPDDAKYIQLLAEELHAKLQESFSMMNFKEITMAMRQNGIGIKDWGKNMNLDLICGVLSEYCLERRRLSLEEERMAKQGGRKDISIQEARLSIAVYYSKVMAGYQACSLMPNDEIHRETLKQDGLIKEGESVYEFFDRMVAEGVTAIYYKQENDQ